LIDPSDRFTLIGKTIHVVETLLACEPDFVPLSP